jgi:ribosomal protein S18 acetylase RimI-like enzyme
MRMGIGRRLVGDLSSLARERDVRWIGVLATPRAVAFYERLGFKRAGKVPTRFGPAVRMWLELE